MSQDKSRVTGKRSATEYRLSITSNSGSRRSSLSGIHENGHMGSMNGIVRSAAINGSNEEDEDVMKEYILPQIRELSDSMTTLDANFTQLNFIHESLVDFNESLGALLYGLMCNSWCVDFPYVSHDIAGELEISNRLESLESEKQLLIKQLDQLRNQDKKMQDTEARSIPFIRPAYPVSQVRRPVQRRLTAVGSKLDDDDDDVANSEASFVSNPTVEFSRPQQGSVAKPGSKSANRLRRKSILHTIRNSIASTADIAAYKDTNFSTGLARRNRLSLGGGATRMLTSSPPYKSATTQGNASRVASHSRTQQHINARDQIAPNSRRQQRSIADRPPFR